MNNQYHSLSSLCCNLARSLLDKTFMVIPVIEAMLTQVTCFPISSSALLLSPRFPIPILDKISHTFILNSSIILSTLLDFSISPS